MALHDHNYAKKADYIVIDNSDQKDLRYRPMELASGGDAEHQLPAMFSEWFGTVFDEIFDREFEASGDAPKSSISQAIDQQDETFATNKLEEYASVIAENKSIDEFTKWIDSAFEGMSDYQSDEREKMDGAPASGTDLDDNFAMNWNEKFEEYASGIAEGQPFEDLANWIDSAFGGTFDCVLDEYEKMDAEPASDTAVDKNNNIGMLDSQHSNTQSDLNTNKPKQ